MATPTPPPAPTPAAPRGYDARSVLMKVYTWPYLVQVELLGAILFTILVLFWSIVMPAPLEEPANPNATMNPAKAPWYFLGLQELLVYFDPWMAGVVLPSLIIVGLMVIPFVDVNPRGSGFYTWKERKFAVSQFLIGYVMWWVLIIIGTAMRGPNWQLFLPGQDWYAVEVVTTSVHRVDEASRRFHDRVARLGGGLPAEVAQALVQGVADGTAAERTGVYWTGLEGVLGKTRSEVASRAGADVVRRFDGAVTALRQSTAGVHTIPEVQGAFQAFEKGVAAAAEGQPAVVRSLLLEAARAPGGDHLQLTEFLAGNAVAPFLEALKAQEPRLAPLQDERLHDAADDFKYVLSRAPRLVNLDKFIGLPKSIFGGVDVVGIAGILGYLVLFLSIPALLKPKLIEEWGFLRYNVVMVHLALMYSVPIKIALRILVDVKYVLTTPWFNI